MTQDLVDDFSEALDREKRGYLICVHAGLDKPASGCHVRTELKNWPEPAQADNRSRSKAHDMLLAIAVALSEEGGEQFEIVRTQP